MIRLAIVRDNIVSALFWYDDMETAIKYRDLGAFSKDDEMVEIDENTFNIIDIGWVYDFDSKVWSKPILPEAVFQQVQAFDDAAFLGAEFAEPSNADIAKMINDLRGELVSAGVIKDNTIK